MTCLRFILGDQLSHAISSLDGLDPARDIVLMAEVMDEARYVPHHQQKIAFIFSAMRHFAAELEAAGVRVDYVRLDAPGNAGSFGGEIRRAAARHKAAHIIVTEPGEWRVLEDMRGWEELAGVPVHIRPDTRFICSHDEFAAWAGARKALRMEYFYREMRRKTGYLMQQGEPVGGKWNFDHDNRARLPRGMAAPMRAQHTPDGVTREVMALVAERFGANFGVLEMFNWPVTRSGALAALYDFIAQGLPYFGDYQDAMKAGAPFLFHALLSPALNIGLLEPREICAAAIGAYERGTAPLNAVEGFVRQIIGWREYVRGIYWLKMPDYAATNALDAQRDLPALYWTGATDMACMREAIANTRDNAYAHHIQRLMITGNFALLAEIEPRQIEEWYLAVYADAYEWVELPNVHGMVMFADGGLLASKPYAASGAYISRMSDYCGSCAYDVKLKSGPRACPFNAMYWNFLIRNEDKLKGNQRLAMPYRNLALMSEGRRAEIVGDAERFLGGLEVWKQA